MPKKKWERPQLIVLVRGKPGETILATCKIHIAHSVGPYNTFTDICLAGTHMVSCNDCMNLWDS